MAKYRTAMGKVVDMTALAAKNERVRAVGNMNVNARGDTIDATGKVIVPVTKKVSDKYQRTVTNRAANVVKNKATNPKPPQKVDLTPDEIDLEFSSDEDLEIEKIKANENKK